MLLGGCSGGESRFTVQALDVFAPLGGQVCIGKDSGKPWVDSHPLNALVMVGKKSLILAWRKCLSCGAGGYQK